MAFKMRKTLPANLPFKGGGIAFAKKHQGYADSGLAVFCAMGGSDDLQRIEATAREAGARDSDFHWLDAFDKTMMLRLFHGGVTDQSFKTGKPWLLGRIKDGVVQVRRHGLMITPKGSRKGPRLNIPEAPADDPIYTRGFAVGLTYGGRKPGKK